MGVYKIWRLLGVGFVFGYSALHLIEFGDAAASCPDLSYRIYHQIHGCVGHGRCLDATEIAHQPEKLKFLSFNLENFFLAPHPGALLKDPKKIQKIASLIQDSQCDVCLLQEIGGDDSLRRFVAEHLNNEFDLIMGKSADSRGIKQGTLIRKSLKFQYEQRDLSDLRWTDPIHGKEDVLFPRDVPIVILKSEKGNPIAAFLNVHLKSKIPRNGDPESRILREAQVGGLTMAINRMKQEFGARFPIVLGGDLNGKFNTENEFRALYRYAKMDDAFNIAGETSFLDRISHTYHPRGNPRQVGQIDAFLVSPITREYIAKVKTLRYVDETGNQLPLPQSQQDRLLNPSDHFPIVLELNWRQLISDTARPISNSR